MKHAKMPQVVKSLKIITLGNVTIYAEQDEPISKAQVKEWGAHIRDCEENFLKGEYLPYFGAM